MPDNFSLLRLSHVVQSQKLDVGSFSTQTAGREKKLQPRDTSQQSFTAVHRLRHLSNGSFNLRYYLFVAALWEDVVSLCFCEWSLDSLGGKDASRNSLCGSVCGEQLCLGVGGFCDGFPESCAESRLIAAAEQTAQFIFTGVTCCIWSKTVKTSTL